MPMNPQLKKLSYILDPPYNPFARKPTQSTLKRKLSAYRANHLQFNTSRWLYKQNIKYVKFLQIHKARLELPTKVNKNGIFYKMALHIKTRTSPQCRAHHQKMLLKYKSISNMINLYKTNQFQPNPAEQQANQLMNQNIAAEQKQYKQLQTAKQDQKLSEKEERKEKEENQEKDEIQDMVEIENIMQIQEKQELEDIQIIEEIDEKQELKDIEAMDEIKGNKMDEIEVKDELQNIEEIEERKEMEIEEKEELENIEEIEELSDLQDLQDLEVMKNEEIVEKQVITVRKQTIFQKLQNDPNYKKSSPLKKFFLYQSHLIDIASMRVKKSF